MIKWYWIFVSLSAGLTIGFGLTFFNLRHLLLLAVKKPGGLLRPPGENKAVIPTKEVIKKIVETTIKSRDLKKTTEEIIEEMNNLPEYRP